MALTFIDAVIAISRRSDFAICEDPEERSGVHRSVCVYQHGVFCGKLRWPRDGQPASVDEGVEQSLAEKRTDLPCEYGKDEA